MSVENAKRTRPFSARAASAQSSPGPERSLSARAAAVHQRDPHAPPAATQRPPQRPSTAGARVQRPATAGTQRGDAALPRWLGVVEEREPSPAPVHARARPQSSPRRLGAPGGAPGGARAFLTQIDDGGDAQRQGSAGSTAPDFGWGPGAAPGVAEAVLEAQARAEADEALVRTGYVPHRLTVARASPRGAADPGEADGGLCGRHRRRAASDGGFALLPSPRPAPAGARGARPATAGSARPTRGPGGISGPPRCGSYASASLDSRPSTAATCAAADHAPLSPPPPPPPTPKMRRVEMERTTWAVTPTFCGPAAGRDAQPGWGSSRARAGFESATLSLHGVSAEEWSAPTAFTPPARARTDPPRGTETEPRRAPEALLKRDASGARCGVLTARAPQGEAAGVCREDAGAGGGASSAGEAPPPPPLLLPFAPRVQGPVRSARRGPS